MKVNAIITEIAQFIKIHRKAAGLTRVQLAELAGVGKTVIFDLEHAKVTVKLSTLLQVLHALNIKLQLLSPLDKDTP